LCCVDVSSVAGGGPASTVVVLDLEEYMSPGG